MTFELSDVWKQIVLVLSKQETEFHPMTKFGWGGEEVLQVDGYSYVHHSDSSRLSLIWMGL